MFRCIERHEGTGLDIHNILECIAFDEAEHNTNLYTPKYLDLVSIGNHFCVILDMVHPEESWKSPCIKTILIGIISVLKFSNSAQEVLCVHQLHSSHWPQITPQNTVLCDNL